MHDLKFLVDNTESAKKNLSTRSNFDPSMIDNAIKMNDERKTLTTLVENKRAEMNKLSKEIGNLKKQGQDATELMNQVAQIKTDIANAEQLLADIKIQLEQQLLKIPNLLSDSTPVGKSEEENVEVKRWGTPRKFDFEVKDHVALGEALDMLDFETAAKLTGARFVLYKSQFARLERALINFMLDEHTKNGYVEMIPPFMVHERSLIGTGQLPKFKEDLFKIEGLDWYLVPTAEVPLTNIKREQIFDRKELPLKYCAHTPCFRSEAGSAGKDTKGLIRLHQFNKVELVNIVEASESEKAHEAMINRACSILEALELPYRAVTLCSADTGFSAMKTIDLEVWLPGQNKYREISSISNCGPFQARRAEIRYRNAEGKPEFAHTLNGSGLAVGRTLVAIVENYQNADGTISIPKVLRPYMGGLELISK